MEVCTVLGTLNRKGIEYRVNHYKTEETAYYYTSLQSSHRFSKKDLLKPMTKALNTIPTYHGSGALVFKVTCLNQSGHIREAKAIILKTFTERLIKMQEQFSYLQEGILKEINKVKV